MSNHPSDFNSTSRNPCELPLRAFRRRRSRHRFSNPTISLEIEPSLASSLSQIPSEGPFVAASNAESTRRNNLEGLESDAVDLSVYLDDIGAVSGESDIARTTRASVNDCDENEEEIPISMVSSAKVLNWRVLWGLILTNGTLKMTKNQYQSARIMADTFGRLASTDYEEDKSYVSLQRRRINCLPHYSTLFKTYRPLVMKSLAVRSFLWSSELNTRSAGARGTQVTEQGAPLVQVITVLPSEYAREDVACGPVFDLMRSTSLKHNLNTSPAVKAADCIDTCPVIQSREWFYGPKTSISVDDAVSPDYDLFAETGDTVQISILGARAPDAASVFIPVQGSTEMRGKVLHVWTVHHESRRGDKHFQQDLPDLSAFDKNIVETFSYVSYSSPSDLVDSSPQGRSDGVRNDQSEENCISLVGSKRSLPQRTADFARRRKAALLEQRTRMEQAWSGWEKPLFKPGDTVVLLEPVIQSTRTGMSGNARWAPLKRLCLIHRFWVENEERGRHVVLMSRDQNRYSDLSQSVPQLFHSSDANMYRDVRKVFLLSTAASKRGPYKTGPISSLGTLDSGERYFIYRFFLYWDGFEIASGTSACGEGFYLIPLNLPLEERASSNSVRVLSLTPPGVKAEAVFKVIMDDVIEGMTSGFADYDSEGNKIRIFLDLVAFIGDTPAINAVLDVLDHTGSACCHLCRVVRRSESIVGSRYARHGYHSFSSSTSRGFYQHTALRDSGAKSETLRLLGISPTNTAKYYPIHDLCRRMMVIRDSIPTDQNGRQILSGFLDPYRSCLVAPDHLLTGHLRDCINFAFRVLPTARHRITTEKFLIGLLHDGKLPVQNRLYDHEKGGLYSMSMTEMYALSIVAELGFVKGYEFSVQPTDTSVDTSAKYCESIGLLRSCSQLIAQLWYVPDSQRDGYSDYLKFYSKDGLPRYRHFQTQTQCHIDRVRKLCYMEDAKYHMMESSRTSKQQKAVLAKEYRMCQIAIKFLDKPNLHRLQELVHCTIPMVGSVRRIGELQLEKKHQVLKRAIRSSNSKNVQLQSVQSAIFTDWQGRLSLQVSGALQGELDAEHGFYRLLAGRDEIHLLQGRLTSICRQQVRVMLGPDCCVPQLLESQANSVLSPRYSGNSTISWTLDPRKEAVTSESPEISTQDRAIAFRKFKNICDLIGSSPNIEFGDYIQCSTSNGLPVLSVSCGDIIQAQCSTFKGLRSNYPIVSQANDPISTASKDAESIPLLWGITTIFKWTKSSSIDQYWASVRLCRALTNASSQVDGSCASKKFVMDPNISLMRLNARIRTAAFFHDCSPETCAVSPTEHKLTHAYTCDPFKGGHFFIKTHADGFPPRKG